MQALVILGMTGSNHKMTHNEIVAACKCKKPNVEELTLNSQEGRRQATQGEGEKKAKKIEDFQSVSGDMKNKDFGIVYGVHQAIYAENE